MNQRNNLHHNKSVLHKKQFNAGDVAILANNDACFNLQFRKDTRHERIKAPTYYRWKTQFVITNPKERFKTLKKVKKIIGCGNIHIIKEQTRFSVQNISDIKEIIVPFFNQHALAEKKKKDFELWQKAVEIIWRNKGKYLSKWKKNELLSLIEIHKSITKHKKIIRIPKWIEMAKTITKTI